MKSAKEDNLKEQYTEEDPLKEKEKIKETRSCSETCNYVFENVTLEPSIGLFLLACIIMMQTTQNVSLEKACRVNLNFTDEICHSLKIQDIASQNEYEKAIQKLVTVYLSARTYITAIIPCILALLIGSWSDKTGHRKIFLIIPIIGQILACISNMLNTYFFYELRLEVLVFSEAALEGFSGGWCLVFFTTFAYISAVTTERNRTFRMGLVNFCLTVTFPIGMGLSGVLLKNIGYYGCYGIVMALHTINLLYDIIWLKDPKRTPEQKEHDGKGFCHFCRTFFDLTNIVDTVKVVFKSGPNKRRLRICVMMLVVAILYGPMYGELSLMYLISRYRFNWDEVKFGLFQTYNFVTHTFGTLFSIAVLSKYLQWHDSILGIISTISKIAASFIYCFAPNERIFLIAPLVEILNGTSLLAMRSIVSKLVEPNELGKVNSIFGLTENLMPLLYVPLFTNVYKATMEVLPGAIFLLGAAMTFPAVMVFIWLLYDHRKGRKGVRRIRHDENCTDLPLK